MVENARRTENDLRRELVKFSKWLCRLGFMPGTASVTAAYSSRKFTSMVAITGTGLPSFMPGLKVHFSTASIAF